MTVSNRFSSIFAATDRRRPYNFHSHTDFCDGHASMADFAAEALRQGFSAYGFSSHSPIAIPSPCNMGREAVPAYIGEFRRLREMYEGRLSLYCAMEIDYLGPDWGPHIDYFRQLPLDYAIGSVHFIPSPRDGMIDVDGNFESFTRKMHDNFDGDIDGVVERFFEQSFKMVEAGGFDILGHIDKIARNATLYSPGIADTPEFIANVRTLARMAAERGMAIEVNTKVLDSNGRMFPDVRYLGYISSLGVDMPVNSDAHWPDMIGAGRERGLALIADNPADALKG